MQLFVEFEVAFECHRKLFSCSGPPLFPPEIRWIYIDIGVSTRQRLIVSIISLSTNLFHLVEACVLPLEHRLPRQRHHVQVHLRNIELSVARAARHDFEHLEHVRYPMTTTFSFSYDIYILVNAIFFCLHQYC